MYLDKGTPQPEAGTDGGVTLPEGGTDGTPATDGTAKKCVAAKLGLPCTKDGKECGDANTCLLLTATAGVCTCQCTPDDSKTPLVNEDDCPGQPKNICGPTAIEVTSGGKKSKANFCMQLCEPKLGSNSCSKGIVCHPSSGSTWGLFGKAVCSTPLGSSRACAKNSDCQVSTGAKCSVKAKDCATGSTCLALVTGKDNGLCFKDGSCDVVSGLCKAHTSGKAGAKVGDGCKGDVDCGNGMDCLFEYDQVKDLAMVAKGGKCTADSDCCSNKCSTTSGTCDDGEACGIRNRNGYCTIIGCGFSKTLTHKACPTGSECNKIYTSGFCMRQCKLDAKTGKDSCRDNKADKLGDYECRAWNNLSIASGAITKGPVCDLGSFSCSIFKGSSSLDCTFLGLQTGTTKNPTNMVCRDLKNNKLTNKFDAKGYCLDDTASGPVATP